MKRLGERERDQILKLEKELAQSKSLTMLSVVDEMAGEEK